MNLEHTPINTGFCKEIREALKRVKVVIHTECKSFEIGKLPKEVIDRLKKEGK